MIKPTKWVVRPVKTQICLVIRQSLTRFFDVGMKVVKVHSDDSVQIWRMTRLIFIFAGHTYHPVFSVAVDFILPVCLKSRTDQDSNPKLQVFPSDLLEPE